MRKFLVVVVGALALAATAQAGAGSANLCAKDWATAQSGSGQAFASKKECSKASEAFQPALTISPAHVGAGEQFVLTATGFHANASTVVYFAVTGQDPYGSYAPFYPTLADGTFSIPFVFESCGNSPDDLTLTFVDSSGVHASARMTLC